MRCPNCQASVLDDSRFCSKCGAATGSSNGASTRAMASAAGLAPGALLAGKYRVLELLGQGGMGVVYKAEDTQLGRLVALKILAERLPQSSEEGRRFLREAKASAVLDHPNICTVYEIGDHEGQAYLAMAFVEGQTLKQKIEERPLKLSEALAIAIQAGEGLRVAHERGVVHRDIKPGNLMVTPQGQVKLLDFGLAKLGDETQITAAGTVMGTPAYMSPEQAKGGKVDRRTDIWSLGVVLYEMLSGRTPFAGDAPSTVARAILDDEPEPVTALRSGLPLRVDAILAKALAKDPEDRYQHVEDLIVDLRSLEREGASAANRRTQSTAGARLKRRRFLWAAAAPVAAAGGFFGWRNLRQAGPQKVMRFISPLPEGYVLQQINTTAPAITISSDGTKIVFSAVKDGQSRLFRRNIGDFTAEPIAGTEGGEGPFLSRDGKWVGFAAGKQLKRVPYTGGRVESEIVPMEVVDYPFSGADFDPEGNPIIGQCSRGLRRVEMAMHKSTAVTDVRDKDAPGQHTAPHLLPGGNLVMFTRGSPDASDIWLLDRRSGEKKRILENAMGARYLAPGYLVYVVDGDVWGVRFDLGSRSVKGAPVKLLSGVLTQYFAGVTHFAVSDNGTLVYIPGGKYDGSPVPSWVDLAGKTEPLPDPHTDPIAGSPRVSPDGERVLSARSWLADEASLGIHELKRNIFRRVAPGAAFWGIWSPDGKYVAHNWVRAPRGVSADHFEWNRSFEVDLFLTPADGAGEPVRLTKSDRLQIPSSFSPDGRILAFQQGVEMEEGWEIWMLEMAGRKVYPFVTGARSNVHPAFSPDGKWLAYATKESGRWEVMVRPFPAPGAATQVSTEGGWEPLWSPDGRRIVYRTLDGSKILAAAFQAGTPPKLEAPRVLIQGDFWPTGYGGRQYDMASDGKRFLVIKAATSYPPPVSQYVVILNWVEEVKRMAPPG